MCQEFESESRRFNRNRKLTRRNMTASKLIENLTALIKEHGDLPVKVVDTVESDDGTHVITDAFGVVLDCSGDDKVKGFYIADHESVMSFADSSDDAE